MKGLQTMKRPLQRSSSQQGAVLIVSLIMLLITTFVGFSAMETSNLEAKMATSRELQELTFQSAEATIEFALDDLPLLSSAYAVGLQGSQNWPTAKYQFDDPEINANARVEFMNNANSLGYSIRKGASGIATYYYQVIGSADRNNTNISSVHTQGIYVEGPSLN
jgi:Tfp pilus assembly protein PilX